MKLRFIPILRSDFVGVAIGNSSTITQSGVRSYSVTDEAYNRGLFTDQRQQRAFDYKIYDAARPIKRYIKVDKYNKQSTTAEGLYIRWRRCDTAYGETLQWTNFEVSTIGYGDGTYVGTIEATYYVKFRGMRSDIL